MVFGVKYIENWPSFLRIFVHMVRAGTSMGPSSFPKLPTCASRGCKRLGIWTFAQKVSNLEQFFSLYVRAYSRPKFGVCKTVVSVESTCCIPVFQMVRKFHVVFHRPRGTTSTKWPWSDCVGKQKARTPEVSVNFLCLLELEMFPMCMSNDRARLL